MLFDSEEDCETLTMAMLFLPYKKKNIAHLAFICCCLFFFLNKRNKIIHFHFF